jgi:hypothetical protein
LTFDRHLAEIELGEHEGVEEFGRRAVEILWGLVAQAECGPAVLHVVGGHQVAVVLVAVGRVVPGGAADAEAHPILVDQVELAQQVDALRHHAAVEVAVAVVEVRAVEDRRVLVFDATGQVDAEGVVPAHDVVRVPGFDLAGSGTPHDCQRRHDHGAEQAPGGLRRRRPYIQ